METLKRQSPTILHSLFLPQPVHIEMGKLSLTVTPPVSGELTNNENPVAVPTENGPAHYCNSADDFLIKFQVVGF